MKIAYFMTVLMVSSASNSKCVLQTRAVPNILFVFYSAQIVSRIAYSYSAE